MAIRKLLPMIELRRPDRGFKIYNKSGTEVSEEVISSGWKRWFGSALLDATINAHSNVGIQKRALGKLKSRNGLTSLYRTDLEPSAIAAYRPGVCHSIKAACNVVHHARAFRTSR